MSNEVGKRLKMIRNVVRFSQKDFAEMLGISLRSYEKWEQGKRLPTVGYIVKIADKLQISMDWLLGREQLFIIHCNDKYFLEKYFKKGANRMIEEVSESVNREKVKELVKGKDINNIKVTQVENMANSLDIPIAEFLNILLELLESDNK